MSSGQSTTGEAALTHRQILVIMSGLMMGMFLASLDQTIVSTALPTIVGDFHRSDLLSWVITAYLLASTATTPLWGKAGDLYGRKRVFQLAIVIFLVGSALCGASQNMYELIGFRGLQGIGGGGLISLVFAIIGDVIPPRERGRYQGYFGAVFGVSSVVGPLAGGFFVDSLSWRYIFYINLPLGIAALVVTNRVLQAARCATRQVQIDWWGALLLVAGVSCILLGTQSGGTDYPWGSWQIIGLFVLGALLLVGFAVRERLAPEPILPLGLFKLQIFTVSNIISFVSGVAMFGALAFLPQYLQLVHGVSATESGLLLLPLLIGLLVMSISSGRYISRTGKLPLVPAGRHDPGHGRPGAAHPASARTPRWRSISVYILVFGAGLGLFMQVLTLVVQNAVPMTQMGVATSSVTFFRSMGGAIGASALGAVLTARIAAEFPHYLPAGALAGGGDKVSQLVQSPDALNALKRTNPALHEGIIQAYSHAIDTRVPRRGRRLDAQRHRGPVHQAGAAAYQQHQARPRRTADEPAAAARIRRGALDARRDDLGRLRHRRQRRRAGRGRSGSASPLLDRAISSDVAEQLHVSVAGGGDRRHQALARRPVLRRARAARRRRARRRHRRRAARRRARRPMTPSCSASRPRRSCVTGARASARSSSDAAEPPRSVTGRTCCGCGCSARSRPASRTRRASSRSTSRRPDGCCPRSTARERSTSGGSTACDIDDPDLFTLQLDSTALSAQACVEIIATAYQQLIAQ